MRSERQWEPKSYRTLRLSFPLSKTGGYWKVFSREMTWFNCLWKGTSSCMGCRETGMDLRGIFIKKEVMMVLTWLVSDKEERQRWLHEFWPEPQGGWSHPWLGWKTLRRLGWMKWKVWLGICSFMTPIQFWGGDIKEAFDLGIWSSRERVGL